MLKFGVIFLIKFLITPQIYNIFEGLIYAFAASTTVFAFTIVNIQPNSKLHYPTKILLIHAGPEVSTHKAKMCEQNASYFVKDLK